MKIIIFILILFLQNLFSSQISSIYTSSCEREIGIILGVDDTKVQLLNLNGDIKTIKRFDIIYIAYYPMGKVKISKITPSEDLQITTIKTLYQNKISVLEEGWMTDYSDKKISFLTTKGRETVVDIDDIWDISLKEQTETITFNGNETIKKFNFVHPYPFASCGEKKKKDLNIYPHHFLETPILIKNELDRLEIGFQKLHKYVKEKKFYPKPQIYGNDSTLAIWYSYNLRYGSSSSRDSSFIPVIENELSEDIYGFQRTIVTGTAPMPYSVHEEPQTQFYYSMKSSYFHMSFMYDFNQLINSDYSWKEADLNSLDDRQNEKFHLAGGFDYRNYAIEIATVDLNYGVKNGDLFYSDNMQLNRTGLFYTHRLFKTSLYIGSSSGKDEREEEELVPSDGASQAEIDYINYLNDQLKKKPKIDLKYNVYRFNLDLYYLKKFRPQYSLIYRTMKFEKTSDLNSLVNFKYESETLINSLYLKYSFSDEDLFLKGFVSLEIVKNRSGVTEFSNSSYENHFKTGISLGLKF